MTCSQGASRFLRRCRAQRRSSWRCGQQKVESIRQLPQHHSIWVQPIFHTKCSRQLSWNVNWHNHNINLVDEVYVKGRHTFSISEVERTAVCAGFFLLQVFWRGGTILFAEHCKLQKKRFCHLNPNNRQTNVTEEKNKEKHQEGESDPWQQPGWKSSHHMNQIYTKRCSCYLQGRIVVIQGGDSPLSFSAHKVLELCFCTIPWNLEAVSLACTYAPISSDIGSRGITALRERFSSLQWKKACQSSGLTVKTEWIAHFKKQIVSSREL